MVSDKHTITGILLAGGKSRRMGQDKGFITFDRKHLFEYALSVLEKTCDEIIISTCKPEGTFGKQAHVCDKKQGQGPLMAISTCLEHSSTEINVILAYDMPLVEPRLINDLLNMGNDYDLVLPALRIDQPQPLCGVYKKKLLPEISNLQKKSRSAPRQLIPLVNTRIHVIDHSHPYYTENLFCNINTPEDLNKIINQR